MKNVFPTLEELRQERYTETERFALELSKKIRDANRCSALKYTAKIPPNVNGEEIFAKLKSLGYRVESEYTKNSYDCERLYIFWE